MPGVVFVIVIPTANFERDILKENNNATFRLEIELRDKNALKTDKRTGATGIHNRVRNDGISNVALPGSLLSSNTTPKSRLDNTNTLVPLEKILEELLDKLNIKHVTWSTGKKGHYHQIMFPLQSGEPCETTLHCLTQMGIGKRLNSSVSVIPCSVTCDALTLSNTNNDCSSLPEDLSKWNAFVESIKSKLTVKQVVDGVRAGGSISFDYILLIVTADSLAALGLIENNAPNIVAAMLVSPLMGPVMSITFGTIISDRELYRVGFATLILGMVISLIFGFIFGLILGTTEMPWGNVDWPTEEMRARGNVRSLWMGVLWALTSGTGVAVALLQGSAGPLIGVAISASLLPPVVNCGLFWALACTWLIHPDINMPYIKGEQFGGKNSTYPFIYTDYLPTEFLINGIVSSMLTVINVICIFITAIIVLKIKEVSAPYTASADLKRFWETDLRTVRKTNRSTMRHHRHSKDERQLLTNDDSENIRNYQLDTVLEQAIKEAEDDVTFKKVKRMSYSSSTANEVPQLLAKLIAHHKENQNIVDNNCKTDKAIADLDNNQMSSIRNSKGHADLEALDKLINILLQQHTIEMNEQTNKSDQIMTSLANLNKKMSTKLNRWRPTSHSTHSYNVSNKTARHNTFIGDKDDRGYATSLQELFGSTNNWQHNKIMPTIIESSVNSATGNLARKDIRQIGSENILDGNNTNNPSSSNIGSTNINKRGIQRQARISSTSSLERAPAIMRSMLHSVPPNVNHRLTTRSVSEDDMISLTHN